MDDGIPLPFGFIISVIVLLLLAAFFAVCETAVSSCSQARMKAASDRGDTRADKVLAVLDDFDKAIATILICTNIVHISTASVVTVYVTRTHGAGWVTLSTVITTIAVFFAGEMLPKSIAKKRSDSMALSVCGVLLFLMKVFSPLSSLLSSLGEAAAKHSGGEAEVSVTEDELYDIIEDMTEEGSLDEEQGDLISSALQFGDVTAESIVTPRVDLIAIDIEDSPEDILELVRGQNHSRLPVYEGSIDNIIGILQIRRFIKAYLRDDSLSDIRSLLEKPYFIPGSINIDSLFTEMTTRRLNIAVVTDNYGGTVGIVTIEDILEELVGEIWDEDDVVEETIIRLGERFYRVDAQETVSDVFEQIDYEDPEENEELVNTLMSEWALEQFSAIPAPGDSFLYHDLRVSVSEMEHNRIISLELEILPEKEEGGEEE